MLQRKFPLPLFRRSERQIIFNSNLILLISNKITVLVITGMLLLASHPLQQEVESQ